MRALALLIGVLALFVALPLQANTSAVVKFFKLLQRRFYVFNIALNSGGQIFYGYRFRGYKQQPFDNCC